MVNSRSQPSFPPLYDANAPGNGPMPPGATGPAGFGRLGGNALLGRSSYGRDGRENSSNYGFPNMGNPYHSPGPSFNQGAGGYQQAANNYSPMHDQQSYGYNHGMPR
jgi:hypothetical protein